MSAEIVREAAEALRDMDGSDFELAVAKWLGNIAHNWSAQSEGCQADAVDVARAYLGGDA